MWPEMTMKIDSSQNDSTHSDVRACVACKATNIQRIKLWKRCNNHIKSILKCS